MTFHAPIYCDFLFTRARENPFFLFVFVVRLRVTAQTRPISLRILYYYMNRRDNVGYQTVKIQFEYPIVAVNCRSRYWYMWLGKLNPTL